MTTDEAAQAILTNHQRFDAGGCLCSWAELGKSHSAHQVAKLREAGLLNDTPDTPDRKKHLKAIYIVGTRKVGKHTMLVMLCSGPDCAGAEMLARYTAADVAAESNAHIDKMEKLLASHS